MKDQSAQLMKLSTIIYPNSEFILLFNFFYPLYRTLFDIKGRLELRAFLIFDKPKSICMIYEKYVCILVFEQMEMLIQVQAPLKHQEFLSQFRLQILQMVCQAFS